jgi:hypothetical protein
MQRSLLSLRHWCAVHETAKGPNHMYLNASAGEMLLRNDGKCLATSFHKDQALPQTG